MLTTYEMYLYKAVLSKTEYIERSTYNYPLNLEKRAISEGYIIKLNGILIKSLKMKELLNDRIALTLYKRFKDEKNSRDLGTEI